MKNLKILMVATFLILSLSACKKAEIAKPEVKVPPVVTGLLAPSHDLPKACAAANGNWLAEFRECENAGKDWCDANRGKFNECGAACRHDPEAEHCTLQCVPVCGFGVAPKAKAEGDKGANGCVESAGYMWCEQKAKCLKVWEEPCWVRLTESVSQRFAEKYKKPLEDIRVAVREFDGEHAKGGVEFSVNGKFVEGGNFLVVKVDGKWKLVFDGNGSVACKTLEPYGFPADMIKDLCAE